MPKITKRFLDNLPPSPKDHIVFDDALPGFGVRIKTSGTKSFVLRYRQHGRSRSFTIGKVGTLTPDEARKEARKLLGDITRGADPSLSRQIDRGAPRIADLAADYLERHAIPTKRPRSVRDDRSMLNRIILPALGNRKVETISRRDIEGLHLSFSDRPYAANRLLALLSKMFNLAVAWQWCTDNPTRGITKFPEPKRDRWLSDEELARLFDALDRHPSQQAANAIRLLLLTGARRSETFAMRWEDVDLERGVWTKPAHTTKQKRTQHTPLSEQAVQLLNGIMTRSDGTSPFVFPGRNENQPIGDLKKPWAAVQKDAGLSGVRLHDLSHTFAAHLVSSGMSLPIVGRLLGHTQPQTTQRYAHLADSALRQATNQFGQKTVKIESANSRNPV